MSLAEWGYENNEYFRYEGDGIWTFRLISCKIRIYFFILEDITNIFLATASFKNTEQLTQKQKNKIKDAKKIMKQIKEYGYELV